MLNYDTVSSCSISVLKRLTFEHTTQKTNYQLIRKHKQDLINKENKQEYCNQKEHKFIKGGKLLLKNDWKIKVNQNICLSLYTIKAVRIMSLLEPV